MYNLQRILIVFCLIRVNLCHGNNWHYSIASMKELFNLEYEHITMMETYIKNEYKRLEDIRCFIEQREKQNAEELANSYTESSINAFKTMVRIKNDWETLKYQMTQTTIMGEKKHGSVTHDNIISVFKAIRRLQIIYELSAEEISNGKIDNYTFHKFDVNDCFQMASICYDNAEYHCAHEWFNEVYKRYKIEHSTYIDNTTFIINYVWSSYLIGNIENAKDILYNYENELTNEGNEFTNVLKNIKYMVWSNRQVFKRNTANDLDKRFYSRAFKKLDKYKEVKSFIDTCQNSYVKCYFLKCRYFYGNHKFYTIGPLREESVSVKPQMELYYNVLYDDEIQKLKHLATPKLERLANDTNEDISLRKVATFNMNSHQIFERISNRLSLITTRPNYVVSDKFVVTNYGLGGHYLPHDDYIDENHLINSDGREALIILHMDDIPVGGDTVVPGALFEIPSTKGSALIVYNTKKPQYPLSEMAFKNTQYGSCPIFEGDKWTLTGWFENK